MSAPKDPWLAVNLSWTAAGLGPLYAGRKKAGVILLGIEALLWSLTLSWGVLPGLSLWAILGTQAAIVALWILAAVISFRMIRREFPSEEGAKTPWKSVFFTRFVPGSGHMYAGHWFWGLFFAALMLVLMFWPVHESLDLWKTAAFSVVRLLILLDSFRILRKSNPAGGAWTGIALVALLIGSQAWLLALGLKTFVLEVYRIPSSSMEPTLLGDVGDNHSLGGCPFAAYHVTPSGDRIIVSKLSYVVSPPRRFDVAVFKFPLNQPRSFVKRVVGLPDEDLMIHAGDLYVRPKGGSKFEIVRKPLDVQDGIWIRMYDDTNFEQFWSRTTDAVESKVPIVDPQGSPVGDVKLSFEVQTDGVDVFAQIANRLGTLKLEFPKGQPGRLQLLTPGKETREFQLQPAGLERGRWYAVELMFFDGQAVVRLDSKALGQFPVLTSVEEAKVLKEVETSVRFSGRQDGLSVRAVRVDRDFHYRGKDRDLAMHEDEPLTIPANQYVCFGDNVPNAHDSRAWVKRTFVLKDGRRVVCETQQVNEAYSRYTRMLQQRLGLPEPPRYAIDGDENGNEVAITEAQLLREEDPAPFRFIDRRFFVGRVVKIWWPLVREGPVR